MTYSDSWTKAARLDISLARLNTSDIANKVVEALCFTKVTGDIELAREQLFSKVVIGLDRLLGTFCLPCFERRQRVALAFAELGDEDRRSIVEGVLL